MSSSLRAPRGRSTVVAGGVNVLANLVAAAVVYLVGVLLGLFPREPGAVAAAVVVTLGAVVWAMILINRFLAEDAKLASAAAGTVLFGVAILIATSAGRVADPEVGSEGAAAGAVLVAGGLVLALVWWRSRRRRLAHGRRIGGLHWYEPR
jgi:hypothetical protein